MLIAIPDVLDPAGVARVRALIDAGDWVDGNVTSGPQAALAKRNEQLVEDKPAAREAGGLILDALGRSPLFVAAALPLKVFPPLFNRYAGGQDFGLHVDTAIRIRRGSDFRIRSDLSATLFLEDPADYDGGELLIQGELATHQVKLPAGHMILYPANTFHQVTPVTRGVRLASFFWIQSLVREGNRRAMLLDLDDTIQDLAEEAPDSEALDRLTGLYHNLLREWSIT